MGDTHALEIITKTYYSGLQELQGLAFQNAGKFRLDKLTQRNLRWMRKLRRHAEKYPDVNLAVIVGNGHLLGEHGLLNLFAAERWEIKHANEINADYWWPLVRTKHTGDKLSPSRDVRKRGKPGWDLTTCPHFRKIAEHLNTLGWDIDMDNLPPVVPEDLTYYKNLCSDAYVKDRYAELYASCKDTSGSTLHKSKA